MRLFHSRPRADAWPSRGPAHGINLMTRDQLVRALFDAHWVGATATAARVERELLRRGQPLR